MANPMEQFEIHKVVPMAALNHDISFTNSSLAMVVALVAVAVFMFGGALNPKLIPGRWQAAVEYVHDFVAGMLKDSVGPEGKRYVPLVFSLFIFTLACNLLGLLPFLGIFTPTSHIAVTLGMAMLVFAVVLVVGFARHGFHFFSLFVPEGAPLVLLPLLVVIEVVSFLSRPFTLAIRLFANMTAGHVLLKVFAGFVVGLGAAGGLMSLSALLPFAVINGFLVPLELLIAVVQAYVFALLTAIYLNDAVNLH